MSYDDAWESPSISQAVGPKMPRPRSGGVHTPGHNNRDFNCSFFACFHLSSFQSIGPRFPLACCRHSFASGNWSSRLLPSTPALCGSILAKASLQSLLLENPSLENLDWLSSFWNFCQQAVASTVTVAQGRQSRRQRRKRPTTPSTGCGHAAPIRPGRHIAILSFLRRTTIHLVQRHECSHLHIYHARILPGAQQGRPEPLFSEPPRGDPRNNMLNILYL